MLVERAVRIPIDNGIVVDGDLAIPLGAGGLVVFAHGSGSSRRSARNRAVAAGLRDRGLGTRLMDLLIADEEAADVRTRELRFDIGLLAGRLEAAAAWLADQPEARDLEIGYLGPARRRRGAGRGSPPSVTCRCRRLPRRAARSRRRASNRVHAPILLIVGGHDQAVIHLNRDTARRLRSAWRLEIVPGAAHLFEEPSALEEVTRLAADWLHDHLGGPTSP
jgi:dienelactone hydrolase